MRRTTMNLIALLACAPLAWSQDEGEPTPPTPPPPLPQPGEQEATPAEELTELFHEVERKLNQIDIELGDAGAGDLPLSEVADAGLDDLLRGTLDRSSEVQESIERILQIAAEMDQSGGGGGGGGQPKPGGESPLDEPRDKGPKQRENTPQQPGGEEPGQSESEKEGEDQPQQEGDKPEDSPQPNPLSGENQEGPDSNRDAGPEFPHGDEAEEWGFLPDRVREVFRNQGRDELPVQYRDWIDTYYRRLNRGGR